MFCNKSDKAKGLNLTYRSPIAVPRPTGTGDRRRKTRSTDLVIEYVQRIDYTKPGLYVFKVDAVLTEEQVHSIKESLASVFGKKESDGKRFLILQRGSGFVKIQSENLLSRILRSLAGLIKQQKKL